MRTIFLIKLNLRAPYEVKNTFNRSAAQSFFAKSLNHSGLSHTITIDKSGANKAGIEVINLHLALLFMLGGIFIK